MKKISKWMTNNLHWLIFAGVAILCTLFLVFGVRSEDGFITLNGENAQIEQYTLTYIEDANEALARIMNADAPTDEETIEANAEPTGQGFYTTIQDIIDRRLPDGDTDGGKMWQCSKYTGYLATGKREYSTSHTDYGPVNGKAVAEYLVKNYGFKYISEPVMGAIGSGGFNTTYGHTVMYLYSTGTNTAMVNDANYVPLKVATHNMNISGYVWVVPGNYEPKKEDDPEPTPEPTPVAEETYTVKKGDTLGSIARKMGWYTGDKMFGDNGYAQKLAKYNSIKDRGLIYPNQVIKKIKE